MKTKTSIFKWWLWIFLLCTVMTFYSCDGLFGDDKDEDDDFSVENIFLPETDYDNPAIPGDTLVIQGKNFSQDCELLFSNQPTRSNSQGYVSAEIIRVTSSKIYFIVPDLSGTQTVILKQNGDSYELGEMYFDENGGNDYPEGMKLIRRIEGYNDDELETYTFNYNKEGKVTSMAITTPYYSVTFTLKYSNDKVISVTSDRPDSHFTVTNNRIVYELYNGTAEEYDERYYYYNNQNYLIKGTAKYKDGSPDKLMDHTNTYSWQNGNLASITSETFDATCFLTSSTYKNDANLNLAHFMERFEFWDPLTLLDLIGERSKYLPAKYDDDPCSYETDEDGDVCTLALLPYWHYTIYY